jgi:hypothetical protein
MCEFGPTTRPKTMPATAEQVGRPRARRLLSNRKSGWVVGAVLIGLSVGCASTSSTSSTSATAPVTSTSATASSPAVAAGSPPGAAGRPVPSGGAAGGGSNARSGPAAGGAAGTIGSVSTSGFTMTTSAGQKVTVDEASSTTYQAGTSSISASTLTAGTSVLVLGTTNSTTITATQVSVQPSNGSAASSAAGVIPFQSGTPTTSKQVGQIPANYTEGSGTIVSGTAANKATEAALAAYPGGVVDRVVQLSNGEYEVHYIGVNWPHHIFVNQDFTVAGAE